MKVNYTNINQRASNKGCVIDRKQYMHVFLRCIAFEFDEIEDIINPDYDLREFEETNDFYCVKELLQPIIDRKLKEIGYTKKNLMYGQIERVDSDGERLNLDKVHKDLLTVYNSLINDAKKSFTKDEIDKIFKVVKEYDANFGLFGDNDIDQRRFDSHFFQVYKALNAVCPQCNHEIDIVRGVQIQCPFCEVWIDTRETKKDYDNDRKMIAGEHGKKSIQQTEGDKNYKVEYSDQYLL